MTDDEIKTVVATAAQDVNAILPIPMNVEDITTKSDKIIMTELPSGSLRHIQGKPKVDLFPLEIMTCLVEPLEAGMAKGYPRDNWLTGQTYRTCIAAAIRHLAEFENGVDIDEETLKKWNFTMHHINAALWNIACIALMFKRGRTDLDDRIV